MPGYIHSHRAPVPGVRAPLHACHHHRRCRRRRKDNVAGQRQQGMNMNNRLGLGGVCTGPQRTVVTPHGDIA